MSRGERLLLALAASACGPIELTAGIQAEDGDLIAYAITDAAGAISETGLLVAGPSNAPTIKQVPASQWLLSWRLSPEHLVDIEGVPLPVSARAGLSLRSFEAPRSDAGACGRCLVPRGVGPQVVLPGSSCTLPSSAELGAFRIERSSLVLDGSVEGSELAESVRARLRLEAPGECPCDRTPPSLDGLELIEKLPIDAPEALAALAADDGQMVYGASPAGVYWRDLSTGTGSWSADPAVPLSPEAGVTSVNGDYLVSYFDVRREFDNYSRLRRYTRTADGITAADFAPAAIAAEPLRIVGLLRAPEDPEGRLFIFGRAAQLTATEGRVVECNGDGEACTVFHIPFTTSIDSLSVADDGRVLAMGPEQVCVLEPGVDDWACYFVPRSLPPVGDALVIRRLRQKGDRVFGCASIGGDCFSFSLGVDELDQIEQLDRGRLGLLPGAIGCHSILLDLTPTEPVLLEVIEIGAHRLYGFAADGSTLASDLVSSRYGRAYTVIEEIGARVVVRDLGNSILEPMPGGSFRPVYGAPLTEALPSYPYAFELPDGRALLVGDPLSALLIEGAAAELYSNHARDDRATVDFVATLDTSMTIARGAATFIANHQHGPGPARFRRSTLSDGGRLDVEVLPWPAIEARAIAEVASDRFVIVDREGFGLYASDRPDPIATFDGPDLLDDSARWSWTLRAAQPSVSAGVVWIAAPGALMRIAGGTADLFDIEQSVGYGSPSLLCPDDVVTIRRRGGHNVVLRLAVDPAGPTTDFLPPAGAGAEQPHKSSYAQWPVRDGAALGWMQREFGTLVSAEQGEAFVLGYSPLTLLQTPEGLIVGGAGGRAAIVRRR